MKKLLVLLLSLLLLALLASCGKKDAGSPPVPPAQDDAPVQPEEPAPPTGAEGEGEDAPDKPLLPDPESTGNDQADVGENSGAITASHTDVTLKSAGETFRLSVLGVDGVSACTFASADPAVAAVDEITGDVTAVAPGQTVVSAHLECSAGQYDFDCIVRCSWTEAASGEDILASLPERFDFSSGVGAWNTDLKIDADGSFNGLHHDANAGESGEGYDATIYSCRFYGQFSIPVQVNDFTYSMTMESLSLVDEPDQESIDDDGIRWVTSVPYGLESADEVLIYLPGARASDLPEDFVNWIRCQIGDFETLPSYGLYNVKEGLGFRGVD